MSRKGLFSPVWLISAAVFPLVRFAQVVTIEGVPTMINDFRLAPDGGYVIASKTVIGYDTTLSGPVPRWGAYVAKLTFQGYVEWGVAVGDPKGESEAMAVVPTSDGGYLMAGYIIPAGENQRDIYVVKLDATGNIQWTKIIGDSTIDERATDVIQTSDGDFLMVGYTGGDVPPGDGIVVKLNAQGTLQWVKQVEVRVWDDFWGSWDYWRSGLYSVAEAADGGYVVAGATGRDAFTGWEVRAFVLKMDTGGSIKWNKVYSRLDTGGWYVAKVIDVVVSSSGEVGVVGPVGDYCYVAKLSSSGNPLWVTVLTSWGPYWRDYWAFCRSISQLPNGGYIISGSGQRPNPQGIYDISGGAFIARINADGQVSWSTVITEPLEYLPPYDWSGPFRGVLTGGGHYTVVGRHFISSDNSDRLLLLQVDLAGNIQLGSCGVSARDSHAVLYLSVFTDSFVVDSELLVTSPAVRVRTGGTSIALNNLVTVDASCAGPLSTQQAFVWENEVLTVRITPVGDLWLKPLVKATRLTFWLQDIEGHILRQGTLNTEGWQWVSRLPTSGLYMLVVLVDDNLQVVKLATHR